VETRKFLARVQLFTVMDCQRILAAMNALNSRLLADACLVALCVLLFGSCGESDKATTSQGVETPLQPAAGVERVKAEVADPWAQIDNPEADGWDSEAFSQRATTQLNRLGKLFFETGDPAALLAEGFTSSDLIPARVELVFKDAGIEVERLGAGAFEKMTGSFLSDDLSAVRSLIDNSSATRHFKFKVIGVERSGDAGRTNVLFALAYGSKESIVEIHATWDVSWKIEGEDLRIARIQVGEFERTTSLSGTPQFTDVTGSALGGNDCYQSQLQYGMNHWLGRMPVRAMLNRFGTPGIAIGDVNGDGLDDLYLCQEPGLPNRLFLQNPDGSARDVSTSWGVDWIEDSRSALLLDFDNDGDQDLAVAIYGNVVIARNEGERFSVATVLPTSGSTGSLSSADYDGDGRLDLYICAYVQDDSGGSIGAAGERFVYHDAENGAPNSLFHNEGGLEFNDMTTASGMDANNRRWSFAASWEDFDDDGDQDLYVANDYGRNNLYRNEGGGRFVDVAAAAAVEDSASGMAASWGDFDHDGRMDLYVSNMFSAAGSRITSQEKFRTGVSDEVRGRFRRFARGNSLFRNAGGGSFDDVSLDTGVNLGRWAWGSSFVDLNNDSWQDLVVANGYLTSPDAGGDL